MSIAIPYYRVSTARQGQSGLGLEVQQHAVKAFALSQNFQLAHEFIEIESGKNNKRPILRQAIEACTSQGATLIIAKLDRLSRNVAFIAALLESGVQFKAADNPYADEFIVHIMAAVAQQERKQISARTKAALQAAKLRGVRLGAYGRDVLSKLNKCRSEDFASDMSVVLRNLQNRGFFSVRALTQELNRLQVPTYRNDGSKWHPSTVHKLIRLAKLNSQT